MKTKNNTQEKVKGQVKMMVLRGIVVIFSLVLISWSVKSQNLWEQFLTNSNCVKMAMLGNEQPSEAKKADATNNAINAKASAPANSTTVNFVFKPEVESALQIEKFNAQEFVEAEMADETENWMNSTGETNYEAVEAESVLQIEEYNAQEFVDAEVKLETENWINSTGGTNCEATEAESTLHIKEYNAKEFVDAEIAIETENWENSASETNTVFEANVEIGKYAEKLFLLHENKKEN